MIKKLAFVVIVIAIGFLCILWLDHTRQTYLPTPGGRFGVGVTNFVWSDAREDPLAPPHTKRELYVWMWYPTQQAPDAPKADYMPAALRNAVERHTGFVLAQLLTRDLSRVHAHAIRDAALASDRSNYPVVLMRTGHSALTVEYTSYAEDLASHGYIVVGFDAPYRTFVVVRSNGEVVPRSAQNNAELVSGKQQEYLGEKLVNAWSSDMSFAVDQLQQLNSSDPSGRFRGRLNLDKVGAFGHSLGGAEALQFCHDDPRCKAGVDVDGAPLGNVITDGVKQPFEFILGDHSREARAETSEVESNIRAIYDRLPPEQRLRVEVRGGNHFNFSDNGVLKAPLLMRLLRWLRIVHLDGRRQILVSAHYVTTFFDVHLRGGPASKLDYKPDFSPEAVPIK